MHTFLKYAAVGIASTILSAVANAQTCKNAAVAIGTVENLGSPIFGVIIPNGYRQWELVAVSYETTFDEFRGILGNAAAIKAYKSGTLPFPDGTKLAKLAWKRVPSAEFNGAFVPGAATPSK